MRVKRTFWLALVGVFAHVLAARADAVNDKVIAGPAFAESALKKTLQSLTNEAALRRVDEEALGHANRFALGEHAASPGPGSDGSVEFVFASTVTRVFCRAQQLCDIELQEGEQIQKILVSDKSQFLQDSSTAAGHEHVVVQPKVPNVTCSMGIYTDRRVYYLELVSTEDADKHMPRVRFVYPEDQKAQWTARMKQEGRLAPSDRAQAKADALVLRPEHLFFGYEIEKEGRWRVRRNINWTPVRAFDDGEKTYIEMPLTMLSGEAPILLVVNAEGTAAVVNYALKGTHFVVGELFQQAILVKGIGRKQERVRITRADEEE
ncbi:MAG: type secretion system protein VirB9 [Myxococcaceae bacterium]|nr:type secretion system protein VirB9 [Myxococcaceae bacterium]